MQETPNDDISFLDMQLSRSANDGPPAQGTDYAAMGIRNYDEVQMPRIQMEHD